MPLDIWKKRRKKNFKKKLLRIFLSFERHCKVLVVWRDIGAIFRSGDIGN
jgi:hypothetical protein